jgi:hypothetical protein
MSHENRYSFVTVVMLVCNVPSGMRCVCGIYRAAYLA